ncbi:hypothetical protein [Micromonospora inositola]|uniref:hypothetical protein n=1 Tax=Micromonospora inositola TaxID=47865 RepID=UPI0012FE1A3F|nr:hypothetical protein [Micromonospora inositola]
MLTELQSVRSDVLAALNRIDALIAGLSSPSREDGVQAQREEVAALPRTKAIEWVLARSGEPMRPVEIWAELQALGRDDPKMEIQVTTYDLWQRGRIGKVGRGLYQSINER